MSIPFYDSEIPDGIFATILNLWTAIKNTYVKLLDWFMNVQVASYGSLWMILFGSTLTVVLVYRVVKYIVK